MMDDIKQDFNNDLKNIKIEMEMSIHSEPSEESSISQSSELCKAEGTQTPEEHDQSISVMDGMKQDLMSDLKNNLKIEKMDWPIQSETPENSSVGQSSKLFLALETQKKKLNQEITFSQDVYTRITPNKEVYAGNFQGQNFNEHQTVYAENLSNQFQICTESFSTLSNFKSHKCMRSKRKKLTILKCDLCQKKIASKGNLITHLAFHCGIKLLKCRVCHKEYYYSSSLKNHKMMIHSAKKPFKCEVCRKEFINSSLLKRHMMIHSEVMPFQCRICQKQFKESRCLKSHEITHSGQKPFKCNTCLKEFKRTSTLKYHEMIHSDSKPFKCEICQKEFKQPAGLEHHKLNLHSVKETLNCDICQKEFKQFKYLKEHKINIHSGEKPFKCNICLKEFNRSSNLKRHEMIHSGIKEYKCSICLKEFRRSSLLKRHEMIHSDNKPF